MNTLKTCFECGLSLTLDNFYRHPRMADGLLGNCKECKKKYRKTYSTENKEDIKEYEARRAKTEKRVALSKQYMLSAAGKKSQAKSTLASKIRFPERYKAREKSEWAIKSGAILREPCFVCGDQAEAHHPDYSSPLSVTWLCRKHHVEVHNLAKTIDRAKRVVTS